MRSRRDPREYAADRAVDIAIEPPDRFETDFVNTVEQDPDPCERIGFDSVALLLDIFHMSTEEGSVSDVITASGSRLGHLYACENDHRVPGSRHAEWSAVVCALMEIDYDGLVVIESVTAEIQGIARAVSTWRPVALSGVAHARDGLRLLRYQTAPGA